MVQTQPKFNVTFKEEAVLAIQKQERGAVVIVLNDTTNEEIDKVVYTGLGDVKKADFTAENYDLLTLAFLGNPSKVIVIKAEEEIADTLAKLDYFDNYTLCYPEAEAADHTAIINYIGKVREKNNYSIAVLGLA